MENFEKLLLTSDYISIYFYVQITMYLLFSILFYL